MEKMKGWKEENKQGEKGKEGAVKEKQVQKEKLKKYINTLNMGHRTQVPQTN